MNVDAEFTRSLWVELATPTASVLDRDENADVAVVGSGIAGLSVAYELAKRGRSVVVLDRGAIGRGMTARTTAHLASTCDDFYHQLIDARGEEAARLHFESQAAAISRIESIQQDERIACDFQRVDGYFFPADEHGRDLLTREFDVCRRIGQNVEWVDRVPSSTTALGPALRFPHQGRVHPLKYLNGLIDGIKRMNGRLYGDTRVEGAEENDRGVIVRTGFRHVVRAGAVVFATNSPINERVAIHTKQAPYRTYAIAIKVPRGAIADALYWDTLDPYHYIRLQPGSEGEGDLLIVGGEDHRSGEADDGEKRFAALEAWTREHFPQTGQVTHRWSGQVLEPADYVPFIGRNPGDMRTYIATGDSGQGITSGAVAGMLIAALILEGKHPWSQLYDPARKPVGAAAEYVRENMDVVKNYAEYVTRGDIGSAEELEPGEGGILRKGLKKLAVYRDRHGNLHAHSAVCPHMGCIVHWNSLEQCWDCPCHGSHFAPDGAVLNGPAISGLEKAEL